MTVDTNSQQPMGSGASVSHKRRWIVGALAGGLVLAAAITVWPLITRHDSADDPVTLERNVTRSHACSADIIGEANAPLANSDQMALGMVVDKITALKDFDRDPNCLYITLQYSLASGNGAQSNDYFLKLTSVYDPVTGYSDAFTVNMIPIAALESSVDFVVQNAKDNEAAAKQGDEDTAAGSDAADKFHKEHK